MITSVPRILEKGQAKLSFDSQACLIGRQCRVRLVRWKTFTTTESGSLIAACAREMKTTLLGIWFMTITTMLIMMNDTCTLAWTFMHTYHLPRAIAWLLLLLFNWQLLYSIHTHLQKNTKGCFLVWRTNRRNAYRNFFLALLQHLWHPTSKNTQRVDATWGSPKTFTLIPSWLLSRWIVIQEYKVLFSLWHSTLR